MDTLGSDLVAVVMHRGTASLHSLVFLTIAKSGKFLEGQRHRLAEIADLYKYVADIKTQAPSIVSVGTEQDIDILVKFGEDIDWSTYYTPIQWTLEVINGTQVHRLSALALYEFYKQIVQLVPKELLTSMLSWADLAHEGDTVEYHTTVAKYRLSITRKE